jgi:small multidrug resistance family-3 protein
MSIVWFVIAAVLEIAGCYSLWLTFRLGRTHWWLLPGTVSLLLFAYALTRVETSMAGRAFAAYGGVYIVASLTWLIVVERARPSMTDLVGSLLTLAGSAVILIGAARA